MRMTRHLHALCWLAGIVVFFGRWWIPPEWWWVDAVLFALLVAVLVAVAQGRYPLFRNKKPGARDLIMWFLPAVISLRAVESFDIVDETIPMLLAAPIGLVYACCCRWARWRGAEFRERLPHLGIIHWVGLTIAGAAMGWALLVDANSFAIRTMITTPGKVMGKESSSGWKTKLVYLDIESMGPTRTLDSYQVPPNMYVNTEKGQIVCVDLHTGLLGFQWREVRRC